ncbi:hypothetical protein M426DRAFT_81937 [Hypoxylon sp. CI-4A]|nr:hypothetical protein M426DRAFT_81937 [Hypoxylon sp. CI-4A]
MWVACWSGRLLFLFFTPFSNVANILLGRYLFPEEKKKSYGAATLKSEKEKKKSYIPLPSLFSLLPLPSSVVVGVMYCSNHHRSFVHRETIIVIMSGIPFPHMQQVVRPFRARS